MTKRVVGWSGAAAWWRPAAARRTAHAGHGGAGHRRRQPVGHAGAAGRAAWRCGCRTSTRPRSASPGAPRPSARCRSWCWTRPVSVRVSGPRHLRPHAGHAVPGRAQRQPQAGAGRPCLEQRATSTTAAPTWPRSAWPRRCRGLQRQRRRGDAARLPPRPWPVPWPGRGCRRRRPAAPPTPAGRPRVGRRGLPLRRPHPMCADASCAEATCFLKHCPGRPDGRQPRRRALRNGSGAGP